jgi:hypothetical protein
MNQSGLSGRRCERDRFHGGIITGPWRLERQRKILKRIIDHNMRKAYNSRHVEHAEIHDAVTISVNRLVRI